MTTSAPNPAPKVTTLTRPEVELDVDLDAEVPCESEDGVATWHALFIPCRCTPLYCDRCHSVAVRMVNDRDAECDICHVEIAAISWHRL